MAKMTATETAQRVIDRAVQLFGGRGVRAGEIVERLYREIRALRIYEGATEVQKLIVARDLLKSGVPRPPPAVSPAVHASPPFRTEPSCSTTPPALTPSCSPRAGPSRRAIPTAWPRSGRLVFVGGQVGWNADCVFEARDLPGQVRQTLQNVVAILAEAGARPEHVTSMTWYLVDKRDYLARQKEIGAAYRDVMGRHFPPMAVVQVSGLIEDAALVEIQATAVVPV